MEQRQVGGDYVGPKVIQTSDWHVLILFTYAFYIYSMQRWIRENYFRYISSFLNLDSLLS